jgi:hypothetical protein
MNKHLRGRAHQANWLPPWKGVNGDEPPCDPIGESARYIIAMFILWDIFSLDLRTIFHNQFFASNCKKLSAFRQSRYPIHSRRALSQWPRFIIRD